MREASRGLTSCSFLIVISKTKKPSIATWRTSQQFQRNYTAGSQLRSQVMEDVVLKDARLNRLRKPVLIITLTDGLPVREPERALHEGVLCTVDELDRLPCGAGAVSFQFAQVGSDKEVQSFLRRLDCDPQIGHLIDCTCGKDVRKSYPSVTYD